MDWRCLEGWGWRHTKGSKFSLKLLYRDWLMGLMKEWRRWTMTWLHCSIGSPSRSVKEKQCQILMVIVIMYTCQLTLMQCSFESSGQSCQSRNVSFFSNNDSLGPLKRSMDGKCVEAQEEVWMNMEGKEREWWQRPCYQILLEVKEWKPNWV